MICSSVNCGHMIVVDLIYVLVFLNMENDHVLSALNPGITNSSSVTFISFDKRCEKIC